MISSNEEFAAKYHMKWVRPLGKYYQIPEKEYLVTAAIYDIGGESTAILAIQARDFETTSHWFTIEIPRDKLDLRLTDFELL